MVGPSGGVLGTGFCPYIVQHRELLYLMVNDVAHTSFVVPLFTEFLNADNI